MGTHGRETDAYAVSTNYMFALGLSDAFGRDGDLLAVMFGQPPKLVEYDDFDISSGLADQGESYHIVLSSPFEGGRRRGRDRD